MIKKINISENDRRTILSMHKLIVEQSATITIQGTVTEDEEKNVPAINVNVKLRRDEGDVIIKGVVTDEYGKYEMTIPNLPIGVYTITFGDDGINFRGIEITSDTTSPIISDVTLVKKSKTMEEVPSVQSTPRVPIFNVKVLNSTGENIVGAEIEIYYKNKIINYKTFVGDKSNAQIDPVNKKTSNDGLKNIWIDPSVYTDFNSDRQDKVCFKKLPIKIVVNYKNRRSELDVETCVNNGQYWFYDKILKTKIIEAQDFTLTIGFNNILKISVVDSETKEKVGPGVIDIYSDVKKSQYIGEVKISNDGIGRSFLGLNDYDVLTISDEDKSVNPIGVGKHDIFLHSFESGYDEFFKKYTIDIKAEGEVINVIVPVNHVKKDNEGEDGNSFNKKSTISIIYGKSDKSTNESDAVETAKKDAFDQYLNRSKKYKDNVELRGKTPDGGKLVFLKNRDDGTYSAAVKYKRGELRTFAKNNTQKEVTTQVEEQTNINFSNVKINEAINNTEGKGAFIFVLGNDTSSTDLYNTIISNKELLTKINKDYINVKIAPDTTNEDYQLLYHDYNLRYYPTLYVFEVDKKHYGFGVNNNGSIYKQLQNYFHV